MQSSKYKLVLASKSPRRKELLSWLKVPFVVDFVGIEEISDKQEPRAIAEEIAQFKAEALLDRYRKREDWNITFSPFIVASDTIVTFENKIFGKPKDYDDAKNMLRFLSGKTHEVITAVYMGSLLDGQWKKRVFSCCSEVSFDEITDDVLDIYLDSNEPFDKAGSYGIQGQGLVFISKVKGSYSNVVGFPLSHFVSNLKKHLNLSDGWRDLFE